MTHVNDAVSMVPRGWDIGPVGMPDPMGISTKGDLYTYIHTYFHLFHLTRFISEKKCPTSSFFLVSSLNIRLYPVSVSLFYRVVYSKQKPVLILNVPYFTSFFILLSLHDSERRRNSYVLRISIS